ncbi:Two component system response regulator/histidine kinase [Desulfonema limicola]|uniref:Two component system response regulator/histidine kinase n=1 Tax=Desulfonema limicola TaxID=45656 RepID=A0A975B527_9BACT|nr:response regulator [Desulfonema limicola]QTA78918.1 Two component system response regulator/histidine kinase [Desulfonema limicola]
MAHSLPKQYVLIVDDDPGNISLLTKLLEMSGYGTYSALNGKQAIKAASDKMPDLILLDVMMPGPDGYETCAELKANPKTKNIPIIFISGTGNERKGLQLGAVDYIRKPFSTAIIKARVQNHLELKQYRDYLENLVKARTLELEQANENLQLEVSVRKQAENDLKTYQDQLEELVEQRTTELIDANTRLHQEIQERRQAEILAKENEDYLKTIMSTIQAGVLIVDPENRIIFDANPCASKMIGCSIENLKGSSYNNYVRCECGCEGESQNQDSVLCHNGESCDCIIQKVNGETIHVRRAYARAKLKNRDYLIQSFLDITDIINLLKKQDINIDLSKNILNLVNRLAPRFSDIGSGTGLFFDVISVPCHKQGGDHYFVRRLSGSSGKPCRTILTLKDQSGHQVGCVLRSIITDLIHHAILTRYDNIPFEQGITKLNNEICKYGIFKEDDFFTSINIEINHETLKLKYVSAGHPPFILIRRKEVSFFPEIGGKGTNIPIGILSDNLSYTAGELQLQKGDQMIFYTDGLIEMPENNKNRIIGFDELQGLILEIVEKYPDIRVSEIMHKLLNNVAEISEESVKLPQLNTSGDDITILCLEIEDTQNYHEIILNPADTDEIIKMINNLYKTILQEWKKHGYQAPETRVWIVLEEGILNAWKHGNKKDPSKSIIVRWRFGNDFHLEIIDQGQGFDPKSVDDPTLAKNLTKVSGRGIFMIRYFCNSVYWKNQGRHMVIYFSKYPDPLTAPHVQKAERFMKLWGKS